MFSKNKIMERKRYVRCVLNSNNTVLFCFINTTEAEDVVEVAEVDVVEVAEVDSEVAEVEGEKNLII